LRLLWDGKVTVLSRIGAASLLGIKAAAYCSTRFPASAAIAAESEDSIPAIKIPRVILSVYTLKGGLKRGLYKEKPFKLKQSEGFSEPKILLLNRAGLIRK
jgi:hypothetical protein